MGLRKTDVVHDFQLTDNELEIALQIGNPDLKQILRREGAGIGKHTTAFVKLAARVRAERMLHQELLPAVPTRQAMPSRQSGLTQPRQADQPHHAPPLPSLSDSPNPALPSLPSPTCRSPADPCLPMPTSPSMPSLAAAALAQPRRAAPSPTRPIPRVSAPLTRGTVL